MESTVDNRQGIVLHSRKESCSLTHLKHPLSHPPARRNGKGLTKVIRGNYAKADFVKTNNRML